MITQFNKYTDSQTNQSQDEIDNVVQEYLGTFERRLYCFESSWSPNVYCNQSCRPFIENLGNLIAEDIQVGYRSFDSKDQLDYYLRKPDGLIWKNPQTMGTSVLYLSCHGTNMGLDLPMGEVSHSDLLKTFEGFGNESPNLIYFSACSVFEFEEFGSALLQASKSRGIIGYRNKISVNLAIIIDLLFLSAFYKFTDEDPFMKLQKLYDSVIEIMPLAKEMGLTLYV